ncbi:MAG: type II secretion system GspH family protein [Rickettsiales bacterium]|jgi:prepilin-type N-terminal cleavage/methylation domain-containing protein|nr:type II secretion system GspH family protein [Rickettsiales bacterium]
MKTKILKPTFNTQQAFTLVEVSIVLVVIGLLTAGILMGQSLIRAAEVRAQASQIESLNLAIATFVQKNKCIPGDCNVAEDLGLGFAGEVGNNGNGNGIVENNATTPPEKSERVNFWYHLTQSNLFLSPISNLDTPGTISQPLKMTPLTPGGFWIINKSDLAPSVEMPGQNIIAMIAADNNGSGIYNAETAQALDYKIDNGLPESGLMHALGPIFNATDVCFGMGVCADGIDPGDYMKKSATNANACINDDNLANPVYNVSVKSPPSAMLCTLVIQAFF